MRRCVADTSTCDQRRAAALVGEGSVLAIVSDDGTTLVPAAIHHDDRVLAAIREVLADEPYPVGVRYRRRGCHESHTGRPGLGRYNGLDEPVAV